MHVGLFPARAGLNRLHPILTWTDLPVPRTRGAEPFAEDEGAAFVGCSPHARG